MGLKLLRGGGLQGRGFVQKAVGSWLAGPLSDLHEVGMDVITRHGMFLLTGCDEYRQSRIKTSDVRYECGGKKELKVVSNEF